MPSNDELLMSHVAALLERIFEDPDSDSLRLVYADALEEAGSAASTARAELIRLQVGLAQESAFPHLPSSQSLRVHELLRRYLHHWHRGLPDWARTLPVRGMLESLYANVPQLQRKGEVVFAREPITHLVLDRPHFQMAEFLGLPFLHRLRSLSLSGHPVPPESLRALLECPALQDLHHLNLSRCDLEDAHLQLLAATPGLPELRRLDLAANRFTSEGLEWLARSPHRPKLTEVILAENGFDLARLRNLHLSPWRDQLRLLDLTNVIAAPRRDGHRAAATLARAEFRELRVLRLGMSHLADADLGYLLEGPGLSRLEQLDLDNNALSDSIIPVLCEAPFRESLQKLDLYGNHLTGRGLERLFDPACFPSLREITLSENPLGVTESWSLRTPSRVRCVQMDNCQLGGPALRSLLESRMLEGVVRWSIDYNPLGEEGVQLLSRGPQLPALRSLSLGEIKVEAPAWGRFLRSRRLGSLVELNLSQNRLPPECIGTLADAEWLNGLMHLDLSDCHLDDRAAKILSDGHGLRGLGLLRVTSNRLSPVSRTRLRERFGPVASL